MATIDILMMDFADFGAQRVALNAANGLAARGHAVRMVVMDGAGPFRAYLAPEIEVVVLTELVWNVPKVRVIFWPWALARLYGRDEKRWLVSFTPMSNLLAMLVQKVRPKLRVMVQEHAFISAEMRERMAGPWGVAVKFWVLYHLLLLPLYRRVERFVTISHAIVRDMAEIFGVPAAVMQVIRNPLDRVRVEGMAADALDMPPALRGRRYVLGVGRLVPQKNFGRLVRVFAAMAKDYADVDLVICGQGRLREEILAEAVRLGVGERVHLVGFQSNPYAWMRGAAAFCLSSDWEGLPQVLAEAMMVGCPVVAHACPSGPDEMIDNGRTGWLVGYEDEEALAVALGEVLGNTQEAQKRAVAAQAWAREEYGLERYVGRLETVMGL